MLCFFIFSSIISFALWCVSYIQEKCCSYITPVLTDENSGVTATDEADMESIGILSVDPDLERYKDHFKYRVVRFRDQINLLEKHEGGLEEFAKGDYLLPLSRLDVTV